MPPDNAIRVEKVLLAFGEQVGHGNLIFASRMNKAIVVSLKVSCMTELIEKGVVIRDLFPRCQCRQFVSQCQVCHRSNELLETELRSYGKFSSLGL